MNRSRLIALLIALSVFGASAVGVAASTGTFTSLPVGSTENAAKHQYTKPGKGCGDVNHEHEREEECRKLK
jgi:hypothetical protein